jgi:hypothetical protein
LPPGINYSIVGTDGKTNPTVTFQTLGTRPYRSTVTLNGLRILDDSMAMDVTLVVRLNTDVKGQLFNGTASSDCEVTINDTPYAVKRVDFPDPLRVNESALESGTFALIVELDGHVPVSTTGKYKVTFRIMSKMSQPLTGWLVP